MQRTKEAASAAFFLPGVSGFSGWPWAVPLSSRAKNRDCLLTKLLLRIILNSRDAIEEPS